MDPRYGNAADNATLLAMARARLSGNWLSDNPGMGEKEALERRKAVMAGKKAPLPPFPCREGRGPVREGAA